MRKRICSLLMTCCCTFVAAEEPEAGLADAEASRADQVPAYTAEELEQYPFGSQADEIEVDELSLGQRFVMLRQRGEVEDLLARHLGILALHQDASDLARLQSLIDSGAVDPSDAATWQALGVVLGDVMAHEFDLHWVTVTDRLGSSRALQWRDTLNFVFPVTVFSRRLQFGQDLDVRSIFDKVRGEVEAFKAYEETNRKLRQPGIDRLKEPPSIPVTD